jgi:hypothetical protein
MDNIKILFSGFIIGLFLSYGVKGCNNQKNSLKTIYDTKIDTLIVEKEVYKTKYFKAKEFLESQKIDNELDDGSLEVATPSNHLTDGKRIGWFDLTANK